MIGKDFKLNSFGIGDCDKELVSGLAKRGHGKDYFVDFNKLKELKGQVVDALEQSLEPFMA
jgi:hypothetical protein